MWVRFRTCRKLLLILGYVLAGFLLPSDVWAQNLPVGSDVWSSAVSRDGKYVASGTGKWDQPGEVGVWEVGTLKPLQRFSENQGIASVAFSPDGKVLAYGSWTGHVKLYEWAVGKEIADFPIGSAVRVAYSPDGKFLATASEGHTVQLWDTATKELLVDLTGDLIRFLCVTFSADGKQILAGGGDWGKNANENYVVIWDVASRKQLMKLNKHNAPVISIACSPDGKTIATGSADMSIRLWDTEGKNHHVIRDRTNWIENLVFTPDSKTLISASTDQAIRFFDVDLAKEKKRIDGLMFAVRTVALSPDAKTLFAGGSGKNLKIFEIDTLKEVESLWKGEAAGQVAMDVIPAANPDQANPDRRGVLAALFFLVLGIITIGALSLTLFIYLRRHRLQAKEPEIPEPAPKRPSKSRT